MIYLYLFGTCFHFIYVFMIIGNKSDSVIFLLFIFRLVTLKESEFMDLFRVITLKTFRK